MISCVNYNDLLADSWDLFVLKNSKNGTIFHLRKFLSYHKNRFIDKSLMFYKRNELVAVLPAAEKSENGKKIIFSHPGSSIGGLVLSYHTDLDDIREIIDLLSFPSYKAIELRLTPYIYNKVPSDELEYMLLRNGYNLSAKDLACTIRLDNLFLIDDSTERSIRKAQDIRIEFDSIEWQKYWEILTKNLEQRHSVAPTHTIEEITRLKNLFPYDIILVTAYNEDIMTAGIVIFKGNENAFEIFYIAQNYEFQILRSLNVVIYKVMRWGLDNSYKYANLGISTEDKGEKVNWGLFKFKSGFGGRGVLRKTYRKELN